jgi:D-arabinose 1-dehydrogenase-like Zn-dependent alcohol dehydrogenase
VDGGFADFVVVSERSVVKLPTGGDRSGRRGPHRAPAPEELGSGAVVAVETDERRQRLARELGADETIGGHDVADAVREQTPGFASEARPRSRSSRSCTAGLTALPALKRLAASTRRGRVRAD